MQGRLQDPVPGVHILLVWDGVPYIISYTEVGHIFRVSIPVMLSGSQLLSQSHAFRVSTPEWS